MKRHNNNLRMSYSLGSPTYCIISQRMLQTFRLAIFPAMVECLLNTILFIISDWHFGDQGEYSIFNQWMYNDDDRRCIPNDKMTPFRWVLEVFKNLRWVCVIMALYL